MTASCLSAVTTASKTQTGAGKEEHGLISIPWPDVELYHQTYTLHTGLHDYALQRTAQHSTAQRSEFEANTQGDSLVLKAHELHSLHQGHMHKGLNAIQQLLSAHNASTYVAV